MRVLSLDLDIFASPVTYRGDDRKRRLDDGVTILSEEEVRFFLEVSCGLESRNALPGAVVRSHVDVMPIWSRLISDGLLSAPFDLFHVDAHDDLGVDGEDDAFIYLCNQLLLLPVETRPHSIAGRCTAGNYLSYAIAYRWIGSILFVQHPECDQDLPWQLMTPDSDAIKLEPLDLLDEAGPRYPRPPVGHGVDEPQIPVKTVPMRDFQADVGFDFVFVSQSPGFVPEKGDWMVDVAREYVRPLPTN